MKRPILFMLLAVSLLRVAASPAQQQPPSQKARIEGIVVRAGNGDAVPRARVTVDSINLIVPPRPSTFRIRGRVVDSRNGQAPSQARVAAVPDSDGVAANSEMNRAALEVPLNPYNASTGEFEVKDLVPGNYTVTAVVQSAGPPQAVVAGSPRGGTSLMGSVKVTVANSNVEGVSIAANPPAAIPGRVRVDGTLPFPMERLRLQLMQPNGPNGLNRTAAAVNPDGAFAFSNITPGDYRLTLQAQVVPTTGGAQPGSNAMYIKEARFDGADVLNGPLRVGSSVTTPLEIVIGVGGGQLTGVLSDRRGQPVPVSQVVLIPDRARDRIELFRISTTDPNGKFSIAGITPGDYKVFSWEGIEPNSWFDPDLLRQSETKGLAVHVTDSSTEMIEVRLITREGVQ